MRPWTNRRAAALADGATAPGPTRRSPTLWSSFAARKRQRMNREHRDGLREREEPLLQRGSLERHVERDHAAARYPAHTCRSGCLLGGSEGGGASVRPENCHEPERGC